MTETNVIDFQTTVLVCLLIRSLESYDMFWQSPVLAPQIEEEVEIDRCCIDSFDAVRCRICSLKVEATSATQTGSMAA